MYKQYISHFHSSFTGRSILSVSRSHKRTQCRRQRRQADSSAGGVSLSGILQSYPGPVSLSGILQSYPGPVSLSGILQSYPGPVSLSGILQSYPGPVSSGRYPNTSFKAITPMLIPIRGTETTKNQNQS
ncbi:hypothetical protein ACOMHN_019939 [Nucella lapillus]